ncbi:MAG TPA: hypothetical protein VMV49_07475 [Candidatus Deferrimicrobium sp.]|nr:hypothetical protein [Candidatus Deferrimicrobium sp.]
MRIPFISKINEKINGITRDLNSLGDRLVDILGLANNNISTSLSQSTGDIKKTSERISESAEAITESLTQATSEIRETAENIAKSADSISDAVKDFTNSTTETIDRFEKAIETSISRLVLTIEDFKNEIVQSGIKVNIAGSIVPRPMQGITNGIRDMIMPKRKPKEDNEST